MFNNLLAVLKHCFMKIKALLTNIKRGLLTPHPAQYLTRVHAEHKSLIENNRIPLHLTKWAAAHESLRSNNKNSQLQCTMFCFSHFIENNAIP